MIALVDITNGNIIQYPSIGLLLLPVCESNFEYLLEELNILNFPGEFYEIRYMD